MKYRSLLLAGLLIIMLLSGCTMKLSKAKPTQAAPTAVLTPPVPAIGTTPGAIITLTSENETVLPLVAVPSAAAPTATPVVEVNQPTLLPPTAVPPTAIPVTPPTAAPTAVPEGVAQPAAYPASAEEVVKAFLAAYPADPDEMKGYLSSGLLANLPADGAAGAAQLSGSLESFTIQSGAASTNPPYAVVQVELKLNGVSTVRIFQLVGEAGLWKINFVDIARG